MRNKSVLALAALCLALVLVLAGATTARSAGAAAGNFLERSPGDVSFLTGPNEGAPLDIIHNYINNNRSALGLSAADLADLVVTDQYTDAHNSTTHIYLRQRHAGIEVFNGNISAHVAADGAIINLYSDFVSGLAGAVNTTSAAVSPEAAASAAAAAMDLTVSQPITVLEAPSGADSRLLLSDGGVSAMDIPGRLVYFGEGTDRPGQSGLRLAWELHIETLDFQHYWLLFVDAVSGELLGRMDLVIHDHFGEIDGHGHSEVSAGEGATVSAGVSRQGESAPDSYEVFAMPSEYPDDGPRVIVTDPAHPVASPFGWHDTDGAPGPEFTITQGNNVSAYQDQDTNGTPNPGEQPDGGPTLDFTGALVPLDLTQDPLVYKNAAVVNLFYWNNIIHDVFYMYGFDEVSGNFQVNNYGNGGLGNDDVRAEAQDGGGTNNANFLTPVDGSRPRMQMYLWTLTTPRRDGDLENSIIVHEYGHGISNRLTGGPGNVSCLGNSEQAGEGWSDWLALVLTAKASDTATTLRGIGTYVLGQPTNGVGIRPAPYTTDMGVNNYTYTNLPGMAVPHGVGFIWATMTWDMYWNLVDDHGFNPDFYAPWSTGGNNLAIQLVIDGMKLQPCSPGFVDSRNAILQADVNLTGGANQCAIWDAFARRGLGFSASQGSSGSTSDGTPAFDLPPACSFLGATPPVQDICVGQTALYNVTVGAAFSGNVAMSAAGHPAGTTATFVPNPVAAPGSTDLTIGNTAGATPGAYTVTITGNDGSTSADVPVDLNVLNSAPAAPTLVSPPNGASGVGTTAQLSWNAIPSVSSYTVEVATDAGFTNIIHTNTVAGTSDSVGGLNILTTYYWRVRATNPCGTGVNSAVWSFTTGQQFCNTTAISIPSSGAGSPYPSDIVINSIGNNAVDVNVALTGLSHTWPDDIDILVVGPQGQNLIIMSDAGGSADLVNVDLVFDDAAASQLPDSTQITAGTYKPTNYGAGDTFPAPAPAPSAATTLSTFDGTDPNGTWSLYVVDDTGGDSGNLAGGWCLEIVTVAPTGPNIDVDPLSLASTQGSNTVTTQTLTIDNTGTGDLNWSIFEDSGPAAPPGPIAPPEPYTPPTAEPVVRSEDDCAQFENYAGREPEGYAQYCVQDVPQPWVSDNFDPTDTAYAQDIGFVSDNFVSHVLNDFPGQTVIGPNARPFFAMDFDETATTLYAIDNTSRELGTYNLATGAFTPIAVVTGIPAADNISGLTIDPRTGVAYVSGVQAAGMTLYTMNLATAVATPIGSDPTVPLLIDIAIGPQGIMYGHEIGTDMIYTIDTSTGAATAVGPTGVNSNFAQGMDFDNIDGTLYAYTYQGGGANVYGTIDLATGALTPLASSNPQGEFEGATQTVGLFVCDTPADIPWASVNPTSGTTPRRLHHRRRHLRLHRPGHRHLPRQPVHRKQRPRPRPG
jgi:hypothetical protein